MQFDVSPMPKSAVTRLFIGGIATVVVGVVLMLAVVWGTFANGVIVLGGSEPIAVNGGSTAWLLVGLGLVAAVVGLGGFVVAVVSWLGALLNTFHLEDRTWFFLLLVMGLVGLGFLAMLAYVIAGPDSTRQGARTGIAAAAHG